MNVNLMLHTATLQNVHLLRLVRRFHFLARAAIVQQILIAAPSFSSVEYHHLVRSPVCDIFLPFPSCIRRCFLAAVVDVISQFRRGTSRPGRPLSFLVSSFLRVVPNVQRFHVHRVVLFFFVRLQPIPRNFTFYAFHFVDMDDCWLCSRASLDAVEQRTQDTNYQIWSRVHSCPFGATPYSFSWIKIVNPVSYVELLWLYLQVVSSLL